MTGFDFTQAPTGDSRWPCVQCGRRPTDRTAGVTVAADGRGVYHCFRCGLTLTTERRQAPARPFVHAVPAAPAKRQSLSPRGLKMFDNLDPPAGAARAYLEARHCAIPPRDGHLRWAPCLRHPSGYEGPAVVALLTDIITREPRSLHFTWVQASGSKADITPPRLLLKGHAKAGTCCRLWPDEDVTVGLGIAEGIESALSLAKGYQPVWATVDAGGMAAFPVLGGIETLVIARDRDPAGEKAADACAKRWADAGREVYLTNQSTGDVNDLLTRAA